MTNWTELKRLAEDTEGWQSLSDCWAIEEDDCDPEEFSWEIGAISEGDKYEVVTVNTWQYDCPGAAEKLARYYAAANPKTILALIAENERLRGDVRMLVRQHMPLQALEGMEGWSEVVEARKAVEQRDQVRAELEALRSQLEVKMSEQVKRFMAPTNDTCDMDSYQQVVLAADHDAAIQALLAGARGWKAKAEEALNDWRNACQLNGDAAEREFKLKAEVEALRAENKALKHALDVKEEFYQDALHSHIVLAQQRDQLRVEVEALRKVFAWTPSDHKYDPAIHHNPDAKAWADLFVSTFPGLTEKHDLMLGWFANAMMAMHDFLAQRDNNDLESMRKYAERYLYLRSCNWNDSPLVVVRNPKQQVKLGAYCPSGNLLDDAIDAEIARTSQ